MKCDCDITVDTRMVNSGGIGTYIKAHLPRLCERFKVVQLGREIIPGVPVVEFEAPLFSISEQVRMARVLSKVRPKVHFHPNYTIPLLYRGNLVTVIHDVFHLANPDYIPGKLAWVYARYMLGKAVRRSDAVVTVSNFQKDEIIKYLKVTPSDISVVHNGVREVYRPVGDEEIERVLAKYDLPLKYVLYVGNVKPHKNVERLIRAMAHVPDLPLVITGERERFITKLTNVDGILRDADMAGRVHFTGFVEDEDLPALYSGASVFVFPSLYEGFGLPPLEAMACGTPTVASKCRLSDEIYGDAYIGVDPYSIDDIAEKIRFALGGGDEIKGYSERGLKRSGAFTWDRASLQLADIIDNIINID